MKILIVSGIFPPDIGGPATYAPVVADALATRGHTVTVLTMTDRHEHDERYPFRVTRIHRQGSALRRWAATTAALLGAMRGPDVVYALGLLPQAVAVNALRRRPLVARVVSDVAWDRAMAYGWTADDLQTFNHRRYGAGIELLKAIQYGAIRRAGLVVVPSRWLANWVGRRGVSADRIRVIPNALAPLPPITARRLQVPTRFLVAAVGRLVAFKQFDLAIRTVAALPDVTLLVIGDGPQHLRLHELIATLDLTGRVILAGAKPRAEMLALLAGCDAVVQSSSYEGLPHVILEAMTLGVPVVATAVGGTSEVVVDGETGLLADGTERGLRDALRSLLDAPDLRRRLTDQARDAMARRVSVTAMVAATEGVLAEAAAQ